MPILNVVSGTYGKGQASYEHEALTLPKGIVRSVDEIATIDVHGGVIGQEGGGWAGDILRTVKGGLSLGTSLELTGVAAIAAGVLSSGLSSLDVEEKDAPKALIDIAFKDGASVVALAHPALAALLLHDRDVVTRTIERLGEAVRAAAAGKESPSTSLLDDVQDAAGTLSGKAGSVLSSAFELIRRDKKA